MIERSQLALTIGTHSQCLPRGCPVSHRTKHLLAAEHQLDRLSNHPGGDDAENLRSGDQAFGPEPAAEEWATDVDLVRGDPEKSGQARLRQRKTLAWRIDGEPIAVPCRNDRMRLHCIVILRRGLVSRLDLL